MSTLRGARAPPKWLGPCPPRPDKREPDETSGEGQRPEDHRLRDQRFEGPRGVAAVAGWKGLGVTAAPDVAAPDVAVDRTAIAPVSRRGSRPPDNV